MKTFFKDKVVIVTGASSGIGEAIAREFAKNGSKIMLAARSEKKLSDLVVELGNDNCDVAYVVTDISSEIDCKALIEKTVQKFNTIDILVNNAGLSMRASFPDVDLRVLHRLIVLNMHCLIFLKARDPLLEYLLLPDFMDCLIELATLLQNLQCMASLKQSELKI
jgi:NADP-dependent 3-hydroxy acid dehydrogenase YdfG